MGRKNNNALFFTCSLIEYIGRSTKEKDVRSQIFWEKKELKEFMNTRMCFTVIRLKRRLPSL